MNKSIDITLAQNAQFSPLCTGAASPNGVNVNNSTVVNFRDPFYASIAPQFFAIAAATVVAYLLVIIIFITPGSFWVGGPGGGRAFLGRRGVVSGTYGSSSVVGVGRRPWLQKIAALSVAVSLTIASADTFKYCKRQYDAGYSDAGALVDLVNAGTEIRVVRVISDTFLWLAQVQTLIRLFPRHKEKVTIKWLGFALILFDTVFSILNNFVFISAKSRPRSFEDAIPALSYLFELAIGLIYAACVVYYSLSKRRFAFWHAKMRNICLVAACSLIAVLMPVVFFVLDVSNSDVATWGGYIRWVGAAAASVVVWEWVERIEALERDERKDGILGRELFDGDEMLDMTPSEEVVWPGRSPVRRNADDGEGGNATGWANSTGTAHRPLRSRVPFQGRPSHLVTAANRSAASVIDEDLTSDLSPRHPAMPPQAITPISRADTSSASTVYAVRRVPPSTPSPQIPEDLDPTTLVLPKDASSAPSDGTIFDPAQTGPDGLSNEINQRPAVGLHSKKSTGLLWRAVPNPFKRRRASPPAEVAGARSTTEIFPDPPSGGANGLPRTRSRPDAFVISRKRKFHSRGKGPSDETPLEVTVIPAQRRGQRTWSPDDLVDPEADEDGMENENQNPRMNEADDAPSLHPPSDRADLPVTVIPAPSRDQNRTWSPQEMEYPSTYVTPHRQQAMSAVNGSHDFSPDNVYHGTLSSPGEAPRSDDFGKTPDHGHAPSGTVMTRRGTLVFSEHESRNSYGSYRRSLYSRTSPLPARSGPTLGVANAEPSPENQRDTAEEEHEAQTAPDPDIAAEGEDE